MNTYFIVTNCCAVQRNETYRIAKFYQLNGWKEIENYKDADHIIITTCGVTSITEDDSIDRIKDLQSNKKENALLIVSGCLPNISHDRIKSICPEAVIIPLESLSVFDGLIGAEIHIEDVYYNSMPLHHHSDGDPTLDESKYENEYLFAKGLSETFESELFLDSYNYATQGRYLWKDETIFEVKISSGCSKKCSYCASRLGIGDYRSKKINKVLEEVQKGINLGYNKIMLMGDELGAYGLDTNSTIIELISSCLAISPNIKIGIRYIHPDYLIEYYTLLKPFLDRIFFLCISVQSASPKVLLKMNRSPEIKQLEEIVKNIKDCFPNVFLHTQIIIGFPNEHDDDFESTMNFLQECEFDFIRYNVFSPREGTEAFDFPIEYSNEQLQLRLNRMNIYCKRNRIDRIYKRYVSIFKSLKGE